jgi:hypothetical protein
MSSVTAVTDRLRRGFSGIYPEYQHVQKIRKQKPTSYDEFLVVERSQGDLGKILQMVISYPLSPMFFFYCYCLSPIISSSPWAWQPWPSTFDSKEDMWRRLDIMSQRRVDTLARIATHYSTRASEDTANIKQRTSADQVLAGGSTFLQAKSAEDALGGIESWLFSEKVSQVRGRSAVSTGKGKGGKGKGPKKKQGLGISAQNTKAKRPPPASMDRIPNGIVKQIVRCMGSDGSPNLPILSLMNRGEINTYLKKVRESDFFIAKVGVKALSGEELELACHQRFIGILDRPDKEMQRDLLAFLDASLSPAGGFGPTVRGKQLNEQTRRLALLGYFAAKDARSSPLSAPYREVFGER